MQVSLSISSEVYHRLKKDILEGVLLPGTRLLVLDIAKGFGVSQAPVREALERLKQEGLIVGQRNKGSVVSDISAKEIRDIFTLREMVEGYAVRTCLPLLTESDYVRLEGLLVRMEDAVQRGEMLEILEVDMAFHGTFYERCGNQAVLELWDRMKVKVMRFMAISNRYHSTDGLVDHHRLLLRVLRSGEAEWVEAEFIAHMNAYKYVQISG